VIALDASALLALLFREAGHEAVAAALPNACISAVNVAEVLGRFARDGHDPAQVLASLRSTPIEIVAFAEQDAALVAGLAASTRAQSMSLGERACLALALARGIPVLTADRAWSLVDVGVVVQPIR
jgi:PIN domain nuclease of toxin-antitoxin system